MSKPREGSLRAIDAQYLRHARQLDDIATDAISRRLARLSAMQLEFNAVVALLQFVERCARA
jgi:hypothetical protein